MAHDGVEQPAGFWPAARYRVDQFVRGLRATLRPALSDAERELVRRSLPAGALLLFAALPPDAQRHSVNVLQTIAEGAPVPPDLAVAALLHDAGKLEAHRAGAPLTLWLRGPLVLAQALAPGRVAQAARSSADAGWRYTLWVHREHPAIGAAWAKEAGCTERTVWLIAHHADPVDLLAAQPDLDPTLIADLRRLQAADNQN